VYKKPFYTPGNLWSHDHFMRCECLRPPPVKI
jgi:hypothetical protein